jgi:hypothetical protein
MRARSLGAVVAAAVTLSACDRTQSGAFFPDARGSGRGEDAPPGARLDAGVPRDGSTQRDGGAIEDDDGSTSALDAAIDLDGGGAQSGDSGAALGAITIAQAIANPTAYASATVTIENVVVVALHASTSASGTSATFYLQDPSRDGPGLAIFRGTSDRAPIPSVGDMVTVSGRLTHFDGVLQIASSSRAGVSLSIQTVSTAATAIGGAYLPAGTPLAASAPMDYAHTIADNHPEQVGNAIEFSGPLQITSPAAFVRTNRDGGSHPEGFEISGGLWVDDSFIYHDCIQPLDGGLPSLSRGIRGVWDRYQDFYAGSAQNPAPTVPVLFPMSCADLSPM